MRCGELLDEGSASSGQSRLKAKPSSSKRLWFILQLMLQVISPICLRCLRLKMWTHN
jgi:hypothetical protein